jgi:hypothetical protein
MLCIGERLCGFLWQSLDTLSCFGWCLGMIWLLRRKCANRAMRVIVYALSVVEELRIGSTCFSDLASVARCGGM